MGRVIEENRVTDDCHGMVVGKSKPKRNGKEIFCVVSDTSTPGL